MKKILSIIICLCLIFSLSACGGNRNDALEDDSQKDYIEQTVRKGKLDICEYGLGSDIEAVKDYYKQLADNYDEITEEHDTEGCNHDHTSDPNFAYYEVSKKNGYTVIETADVRFYYTKNTEDGITAIASDSAVFGFTPAVTTKYEVEDAIAASGKTVNANEDDLKLLAMPSDSVIILRYTFDEYQLDFYFYENSLITTVILDREKWEI